MATFKDAKERVWALELDPTVADEIAAEKGLDLIDPDRLTEVFSKLGMGSTRLLVEVLYMLCHEQAEAKQITPEDFGRAMKPKALQEAFVALQEAVSDFSQSPEIADARRKIFRACNEKMGEAVKELTQEKLRNLLTVRISGANSGGSLESPDSTHGG